MGCFGTGMVFAANADWELLALACISLGSVPSKLRKQQNQRENQGMASIIEWCTIVSGREQDEIESTVMSLQQDSMIDDWLGEV